MAKLQKKFDELEKKMVPSAVDREDLTIDDEPHTGLSNVDLEKMAAIAFDIHQRMSGTSVLPNGGNTAPPTRTKTGWPKVLLDVEACLKNGETPSVLKLSRANRDRLQDESRAVVGKQKISIGSGHTICLAEGSELTPSSQTTARDGPLWSGMSVFFRLFSMVSLPEEEFSRAAMADFLSVWTEVWDSPKGSRAQRLKFMSAFYTKHVGTLGQDLWMHKMDTDSRLRDNFREGWNPAPCSTCNGTGERTVGQHPGTPRGPRGHRGARNGGGDGGDGGGGGGQPAPRSSNKRDRLPKAPCFSRLALDGICDAGSAVACPYVHDSPCVSCGGTCARASACKSWDPQVVEGKYGRLLSAIRRGGKRQK